MCGIAAILGAISKEEIELPLHRMLDAQVHRGPDDGGAVVISTREGSLGLGNRRLAIQDISRLGHQPIHNDENGDILVYNGEIYNSFQLRQALETEGYHFRGHSDTEVLLRAYQKWGVGCLDRLRGMFAFVVWDANRSRLLMARDHFGIKPLYYISCDRFVACASEIRALLESGLVKPDIDRRALAGYLAYGAVQEPLTILENVFALPPGSWKEFDASGKAAGGGTYWQLPQVRQSARTQPISEILEQGRALLQGSVERHLLSDVPVGIFLSGGLDSTAILGLTQNRGNALEAFTVSFPDRHEEDEHRSAEAAAARFGARFHQCQISDSTAFGWMADAMLCLDQPSMDGFNTYIVSRAIRGQGISVALSGLGGDEIFGGYNLFRRVPVTYDLMTWIGLLPISLRMTAANLSGVFTTKVAKSKAQEIAGSNPGLLGIYFRYRRLLSDFDLEAFGLDRRGMDLSEDFQLPDLRYEDSYVPSDHVASVARLETSFYLRNVLLRDSDVFGMANSLEIRVPFLDRDLAEWAFRLPGNVLLPRKAPLKYLLKRICADFYTKAQLKQPKRGFVLPFSHWLQGPLRELMEENLRNLRGSGILDPAGIDRVRKLFDAEPHGPAWSRVWSLVTLGSWLKTHQTGSCFSAVGTRSA